MNTITVRVTKNYGTEVIYPVSDKAKLFADLSGTRTLTKNAINLIKKLGYEIYVQQGVVRL
jgi:hypothetical protein